MSFDSSRRGFSLLEVMIATAVLAASAMVLLSLISLGTRFGSKAEIRMGALIQAQSILDESILRMHSGESIESYTGVLAGSQPRGYRVTIETFEIQDPSSANGSYEESLGVASQGLGRNSAPDTDASSGTTNGLSPIPGGAQPSELVSVKVELYETEGLILGGRQGATGPKPLIELSRLVRRARVEVDEGGNAASSNGNLGI